MCQELGEEALRNQPSLSERGQGCVKGRDGGRLSRWQGQIGAAHYKKAVLLLGNPKLTGSPNMAQNMS